MKEIWHSPTYYIVRQTGCSTYRWWSRRHFQPPSLHFRFLRRLSLSPLPSSKELEGEIQFLKECHFGKDVLDLRVIEQNLSRIRIYLNLKARVVHNFFSYRWKYVLLFDIINISFSIINWWLFWACKPYLCKLHIKMAKEIWVIYIWARERIFNGPQEHTLG